MTQSLCAASSTQHPTFKYKIVWTREVLEFYMSARYKSHEDASLSCMDDALYCIHTFKEVFLLGQPGNKAMAKSNTLTTELVKQ
jgi:hypothetical protein